MLSFNSVRQNQADSAANGDQGKINGHIGIIIEFVRNPVPGAY